MQPENQKWVPKAWGGEKWIVNNSLYCGKILVMIKGKKLSYHYHNVKKETFYILSGKVKLLYNDNDDITSAKEVILNRCDSFQVDPGLRHQLYALEDAEIIEFSTHHEDEDSIRIIKGD